MLVFWLAAALMTLAAMAFVLVPLLRPRPVEGPSTVEANLDVLRSQRREIEADVAAGTLPADAREEALAELVSRAEGDLAEPSHPEQAASRRPWPAAVAAAVAVPAIAFGVYLAVGTPGATDPKVTAAQTAPASHDPQIASMVEELAKKVRERPDDVQGWTLLARSMASLGRFRDSADAYAHLVTITPPDAQILADYADALGMAQGGTLQGKPVELVARALEIDPRHRKSLALAGTAALDAGDLVGANRHWQVLAAQLPPGSEDETQVRNILEEVRQRAASSGVALPSAPVAAKPAPAAGPKTVSGSVKVAPQLATRVAASDSLFIFARPEGGARVPLAVLRASARELPLAFTLDDSLSMSPQAKLSQADAVRIEARLSRSGNATPQPGDLVGTSGVVKPGAKGIEIVIDRELGAPK